MLIQQKTGNIKSININDRIIDMLHLEWYETNKRILHKSSTSGIKLTLKFLKEDPSFTDGDIVFENDERIVVIDILPVASIVIKPLSMFRMASLCYEIGNKHLPLFIEGEEVLVVYEEPLFRWLSASGFDPSREIRKLLNPLKTTTMAHSHGSGSSTLFTKIMQLTNKAGDE